VTPQAAPSPSQQDERTARLEELRPGLRLLALRSLGSADAADEVVQETFSRAVQAIARGLPNDPEKLPAFVAGIARHVTADTLRAQRRLVSLESLPLSAHPAQDGDALSALVSVAERLRVRAALSQLSTADRELLRLCYFDGLAATEVAARLGEPEDRIRKRKSRALERLRRAFHGDAGHTTPQSATEKETERGGS
jgi:RNA polymerase sigma factor (sigma-70 family)